MNYKDIADTVAQGNYDSEIDDSHWKPIFSELMSGKYFSLANKDLFHTMWTVNGGHLRRKVNDDQLVLEVLKAFLPGYSGEGMVLYRGERQDFYRSDKIGFCWTPDVEVAKKFARGLNAIESGGVLLEGFAPSQAILAEPNSHSAETMKEYEYTCNSSLIENLKPVEFFPKL